MNRRYDLIVRCINHWNHFHTLAKQDKLYYSVAKCRWRQAVRRVICSIRCALAYRVVEGYESREMYRGDYRYFYTLRSMKTIAIELQTKFNTKKYMELKEKATAFKQSEFFTAIEDPFSRRLVNRRKRRLLGIKKSVMARRIQRAFFGPNVGKNDDGGSVDSIEYYRPRFLSSMEIVDYNTQAQKPYKHISKHQRRKIHHYHNSDSSHGLCHNHHHKYSHRHSIDSPRTLGTSLMSSSNKDGNKTDSELYTEDRYEDCGDDDEEITIASNLLSIYDENMVAPENQFCNNHANDSWDWKLA